MNIQIKTDGRPTNVVGPPLPFSWLNNLKVVAKKNKGNFIVSTKEIATKLRQKDYPHGIKFAEFFEEVRKNTKYLVFESTAVIEIN